MFLEIIVRSTAAVRLIFVLGLALAVVGCVPSFTPLSGVDYDGALPTTGIAGHRLLIFNWEFNAGSITERGEGAIRMAAPDSARIDIYFAGNESRYAFVYGDSLSSPWGDEMRDMLPPPELIWAAVGRLSVPSAADTVKKVRDGLLFADLLGPSTWRATFDSSRLTRLERAQQGRITESITRRVDASIVYMAERPKRQLRIIPTRDTLVAPFAASIWRD